MKINLFSCLLWKPIYLFIYLHIYLLLVLLFATCNALCTSISILKAKGFSFSGLFQNLNCHVKCLCQILFMLTRYLNTSWPLLPIIDIGVCNERTTETAYIRVTMCPRYFFIWNIFLWKCIKCEVGKYANKVDPENRVLFPFLDINPDFCQWPKQQK